MRRVIRIFLVFGAFVLTLIVVAIAVPVLALALMIDNAKRA